MGDLGALSGMYALVCESFKVFLLIDESSPSA